MTSGKVAPQPSANIYPAHPLIFRQCFISIKGQSAAPPILMQIQIGENLLDCIKTQQVSRNIIPQKTASKNNPTNEANKNQTAGFKNQETTDKSEKGIRWKLIQGPIGVLMAHSLPWPPQRSANR